MAVDEFGRWLGDTAVEVDREPERPNCVFCSRPWTPAMEERWVRSWGLDDRPHDAKPLVELRCECGEVVFKV